jgi:hypothetical protein
MGCRAPSLAAIECLFTSMNNYTFGEALSRLPFGW